MAACRLGCNEQPIVNSNNNSTTLICQGGYNDGLDYSRTSFFLLFFIHNLIFLWFADTYSSICRYYQPWQLSAICGAFIVVYQSFLEFVATCSCIQGRCTNCACSCNIFKRLIECCGGTILAFFTIITTILLLYSVLACYYLGAKFDIFANILLSKMWSVGEWFIWSAPFFMYRHPLDRRRYLQKQARKTAKVTDGSNDVEKGKDHLSAKKAILYASDALNMFVG